MAKTPCHFFTLVFVLGAGGVSGGGERQAPSPATTRLVVQLSSHVGLTDHDLPIDNLHRYDDLLIDHLQIDHLQINHLDPDLPPTDAVKDLYSTDQIQETCATADHADLDGYSYCTYHPAAWIYAWIMRTRNLQPVVHPFGKTSTVDHEARTWKSEWIDDLFSMCGKVLPVRSFVDVCVRSSHGRTVECSFAWYLRHGVMYVPLGSSGEEGRVR